MKQILFSILAVCLHQLAFAQFKLSGLTTMYSGTPTSKSPVIAIAITSADAEYQYAGDDSRGFEYLLKGRNEHNMTIGQVFDTSGVHFMLVTEKDIEAGRFEYRLLKNAVETVKPWTVIGKDPVKSVMHTPMSYLGHYQLERGHFLLMDIRRKGEDTVISSALVSFRETRPTLDNIYLADEMKPFMKRIADPDAQLDSAETKKWQLNYSADELDPKTGLPVKLELANDQNSLIFFLREKVRKADVLEYQVIRNGEVYRDWGKNDFDNGFVWLTNLPPGDYELKMRFKIQKENVTSYPFVIHPRWDQTLSFKLIIGGLVAAFFGFIALLFFSRRQKQKLRAARMKKNMAEAELRSIYAQLNPHFIFNALSSIQGLINKNETEKANRYLSTFSRLLRDSLVNGEKNHVPVSAEIETLQTYLQLEQLRFGFEYSIEVEGVDTASVEIPSLLLQPLVENAIKHGVSAMQEEGRIAIRFIAIEKDMQVIISDNGRGFDITATPKGFGLKLTRQRMALLNEQEQEQVEMKIRSAAAGTTITVIFKNLLA